MDSTLETQPPVQTPARTAPIKIFGVGTAGIKVLEQLAAAALPDTALAAVATDAQSLAASPAAETICLEPKQPEDWRAGGEPEHARAVAEANLPRLKAACDGARVIFILAGLGGSAGTGISPVLARAAKQSGALALAFVTAPFDCEGNRRQRQAQLGLEQLKAESDGVICLPNQKISRLIDEQTRVLDAFKLTDGLLAAGVCGLWQLLARKGLLEIHVGDLCDLLRDGHGESAFATAEAAGATRSREALDKLLAHPMLDGGQALADADAVLVSLVGGPDLTMSEVSRVMDEINGKCARAQVLVGAALDENFRERLAITLIATRHGEAAALDEPARAVAGHAAERLDAQLLERAETPRPQSRFVPPPPAMTPDKIEQLLARQGAGASRGRRSASKMRQGTLPLEIVSKGRFDKSEPTIHKGEDLDVPTYIRRGVPLN